MRSLSKQRGMWWLAGALMLVAVGVTVSFYAARLVAHSQADRERDGFRTDAERIASTVKLATQREEDLVAGAGALLVGSPRISNSKFRRWTELTQVFERQPEVTMVGYNAVVRAHELSAYAARIKADPPGPLGPGGSYTVTPKGQRPFYCLIGAAITRPGTPTLPIGVDRCDPRVPDTNDLFRARDSGQSSFLAIAAGPVTLLAVVTPVYKNGQDPGTVAARRSAVIGWTGVVFLPSVVLDAASKGFPHTAVSLRRDVRQSEAVFRSSSEAPAGGQSVTIPVDGGWTVRVTRGPIATGLLHARGAIVILVAGSLLSVLLGLLMAVLGTSRSRALRLVTQKTGELQHIALHDALTGLPNRALVIDRTERMVARAARLPVGIAALFIDLDGFKQINDSFGHGAGDHVLKTASERMLSVVRDEDTVGRLGGDEFVVLLESITADSPPQVVAERLIEVLRQPIELDKGGKTVAVSASVGIAVGRQSTADELLRDADLALYAAKAAGKDRYALFDTKMQLEAEDRTDLKFDLRTAIDEDQFFLMYQPTIDLHDKSVTGVEALVRWEHPTRGTIAPDDFIPLAEETGLIVPLGRWVLRHACDQAAIWHRAGHPIGISVNVSAVQLDRDGLEHDVQRALEDSGLLAEFLTLELTETALMDDVATASERLIRLKALGVRIAIDDFGTGYSSLAYLRQFPIDSLKIDRSFIAGIADSSQSRAIISTLVQLGKTLNIETLAEGIEDQEQLDRLENENVDRGQGFLFAKPLAPDAIEAFLDAGTTATTPTPEKRPVAATSSSPSLCGQPASRGTSRSVDVRCSASLILSTMPA